MSALTGRAEQAVLVIDVQRDVVAAAHDRDGVVAAIGRVVADARHNGVPVIWVQHRHDVELPAGSDGWQIVDELVPNADEPIVHKRFRDAFLETELESLLADRRVSELIVTGAQTDFCVRWTLHGAHARGYDTMLVADGHTTDAVSPSSMPNGAELIAHTNAVWASQTAPSQRATVVTAADISWRDQSSVRSSKESSSSVR